ncbi:MAG: hypothetical protein SVM79_01485, partial [Chloroflexota bacterium]|nr:hypothetical protein [Chloroflexota bacterium]
IALGIVLGYLIEIEMINMFQADMMTLRIAFTVRSYVITAIGVMLVLVLSQLPSIRYVNNLNLARMTKEQAT